MFRRQKLKGVAYFQLDVPAGGSGYIDSKPFVAKGSITLLDARFYGGQENTLLVCPVLMDAQGTYDEMIETYGDMGKGVISGENDNIKLEVDVPFDKGDKIRLYYNNTNTAGETYTLKMWVAYNYEGGEQVGGSQAVR